MENKGNKVTPYAEKALIFVQIVDASTFMVTWEVSCGEHQVSNILEFMQVDEDEFDGKFINSFEDEVDALAEFFNAGIPRPTANQYPRIEMWSAEGGLPYRLHAGRELSLMKAKEKPLAYFFEFVGGDGLELKAENDAIRKLFSDLIENNLVSYRAFCEIDRDLDSSFSGTRTDIYCLPGEEWRIDALIMIRRYERKFGRSNETMNLLGILLGYTDDQNQSYSMLIESWQE